MDTKTKKTSTETTSVQSAVLAFTEWLHGQREYIILVKGNKEEENLCCVDGNLDGLSKTLFNGMIQHEELYNLVLKAATSALVYKNKGSGDDI